MKLFLYSASDYSHTDENYGAIGIVANNREDADAILKQQQDLGVVDKRLQSRGKFKVEEQHMAQGLVFFAAGYYMPNLTFVAERE